MIITAATTASTAMKQSMVNGPILSRVALVVVGSSNGISRRLYWTHNVSNRLYNNAILLINRKETTTTTTKTTTNIGDINKHERYTKNIARLYARYIIDSAAASALAYKLAYSQLESSEFQDTQPQKPMNWYNWKRKEWSNELYNAMGKTTIERTMNAILRIVQLSTLVTPLLVLYPLSFVSSYVHTMTWKYSLWGIEKAGPTYIKLIQWATTRQDLFSIEFCNYFGKLRDETIGHTWDETIQIIQEELNIDVSMNANHNNNNINNSSSSSSSSNNNNNNEQSSTKKYNYQQRQTNKYDTTKCTSAIIPNTVTELEGHNNNSSSSSTSVRPLLQLDPKPIGSGCIAQVYKGVLLQSIDQFTAGTEIAVKVQHPNIFHGVCCDFYILLKIASFLESIPNLNLRYLSLYDTVSQFRDIMLPQLNLQLECNHLKRFIRDFHNDTDVNFPIPIESLTTSKVLIETFLYGKPIMEYTTAPEQDRKEIALLGLRTTLKMIFVHDFLHGDLHPGNMLVSGTTGKYKLNLLDCGLVIEMGPEQHVNLVKILGAFTRKNGALAGRLMVDTQSTIVDITTGNPVPRSGPEDVELFVKGIEQIVLNDRDNNFVEKVGEYIADICYLACYRKVKLEPAFINAALAVEIMEGIATALDPALNVSQTALPMVMQAEVMHMLPKFHLW